MLFKYIGSNVEIEDSELDLIYSRRVKMASKFHFTPIKVAKVAAHYLAESRDTKILDVGSGAGKFCMIGSVCTGAYFVGVEQRKNLCRSANRIAKHYNLNNVEFINTNITNIDFKDFDAFYFFNPFFENVCPTGKIDNSVELRPELYNEYSNYVKGQLDQMPIGTKLVTYFSSLKEVPESFEVRYSILDNRLKMWEKAS